MAETILGLFLVLLGGVVLGWLLCGYAAYRIALWHEKRWGSCEDDEMSLCKWMISNRIRRDIQKTLLHHDPEGYGED